jgi:F-type H+-transporting ATPase subunit epsilon
MANSFKLEVVTPLKKVLSQDVEFVLLRTTEGDMGILANHAPFVAELAIGEMKVKAEGKEEIYYVSGGFLEISRNKTIILADEAMKASEIDVERARKEAELAQAQLKKLNEEKDLALVQKTLLEALAKVKIAEKHL